MRRIADILEYFTSLHLLDRDQQGEKVFSLIRSGRTCVRKTLTSRLYIKGATFFETQATQLSVQGCKAQKTGTKPTFKLSDLVQMTISNDDFYAVSH